ncbi:tetratricopeptide (TPR) repeat protein [Flavobacterium arsenatis]|uniref:Tetratricopeptide (TPR) repeat protein n=1 Tax=Flavobacterium arsenatis TaxID=1484332 RepID=A0ABU1TTE8_9FLAO|nr:tetratricopeptide repeat protein [Flavobacterium arsenatis]MDR6969140.1 tetratricopeptide (TPR) repeat protein [Flavobacterium arsenatis]
MFTSNRRFRYWFFSVLICLFFSIPSKASTIEKCDSLIVAGVTALNNNQYIKSLEFLTQARTLAEKNRWHKQSFLAINNIGANYYRLLEYGEALNYYIEAYSIALKELDPKFEMIVLNNIAILYSKELNYEKAKEYFRKAYDIAKQNEDGLKIGLYAMNLGNLANEQKDSKLARTYFNEALPLLVDGQHFLILAKVGLIQCDLNEGKATKARQEALHLIENTKDLSFYEADISLTTVIAKSYIKDNLLDEATTYVNLILGKNPNIETKITAFELLSEINFKKKNYDLAFSFKDSVMDSKSKLNEVKNGKLYETSKVKFEIQNYQNQIKLNEAKLSSERKMFYSIIAIIIIVVIFIVWILRNLSVKHKQKKLIAERNEQILALELEKEKNDLLLLEKQLNEQKAISMLEQERLKNEVEQKNRKLSAKALYLSGRNQMIEEVLSELSELPQVSSQDVLVNHIQTLKTHLKTDNEWDSFITHFEEVNQNFLNKLKSKHPNLIANDIRFLSYIYMNLSTKEIASMLNIAPESCRKRKERISAKMEIPDDISLYDYLATI